MKSTNSFLTSKSFSLVFTLFLVYPNEITGSKQLPNKWVDPDGGLLQTEESRLSRESWQDPDDVKVNVPESLVDRARHRKRLAEVEESLLTCEIALSALQSQGVDEGVDEEAKSTSNDRATTMKRVEALYAQRFVGILLAVSGLKSATLQDDERRQGSILLDIDTGELKMLQEFVDKGLHSLEEVNEVLSNVLTSSETNYNIPLGWIEQITESFSRFEFQASSNLTPYALSVFVFMMVIYRRRFTEVVVTFLVVVTTLGYQSTYHYMLKMAEIEHMVKLHKYDTIPASCLARATLSPLDRMALWWSGERNDCRDYFVAQHMPPEMGVSATLVLSEMLTSFVVHPLEKIGEGIGKFTAGALGNMSFFQGMFFFPIVLALLLGSTVVLVVLLSGGRIRLPYYLGGGELSGGAGSTRRRSSSPRRVTTEPAHLEDRIRAISREELRVHRIVQQLSSHSVASIVDRLGNLDITGNAIRDQRLGTKQKETVRVVPPSSADTVTQTKWNFISFPEEIVTVGALVDVSEQPSDVSILDEINMESNCASDGAVSGGGAGATSEKCLLDSSLESPGFLHSLQKILREPESTADKHTEEDASCVRSEFITSIESIMLDSSTEEVAQTSRKSSKDSSEESGDFIKL